MKGANQMNDETFQSILARKNKNNGQPFWGDLADKYGFSSKEQLRSAFRRASKKARIFGTNGTDAPAVLVMDIETLPIVAYTWGAWDQNINMEQIIKDWVILGWSGKWLDDDKIISDILTPKEAVNRDDGRIVKNLWKLLDDADIVIAHNGKAFDLPRSNTRFLYHKMGPPSSYKVIDTLIAARSAFGLTYNRLDYVAKYLGAQRKKETDFQLWIDCDHGDKEALQRMQNYNIGDVETLEQVYLKIRSYIPNHPRLTSYDRVKGRCPVCLSDYTLIGTYQAPIKQYPEYRCNSCGAVFHSTKPNP
jgi:hypothetical protein